MKNTLKKEHDIKNRKVFKCSLFQLLIGNCCSKNEHRTQVIGSNGFPLRPKMNNKNKNERKNKLMRKTERRSADINYITV